MNDEDPSEVTREFVDHPVRMALLSGAAVTPLMFRDSIPIIVVAATASAVAILQWSLWRPGGPGHRFRRYMLRRFPPKEQSEDSG